MLTLKGLDFTVEDLKKILDSACNIAKEKTFVIILNHSLWDFIIVYEEFGFLYIPLRSREDMIKKGYFGKFKHAEKEIDVYSDEFLPKDTLYILLYDDFKGVNNKDFNLEYIQSKAIAKYTALNFKKETNYDLRTI